MENLKVVTTFSGVGMQELGIINTHKFNMEVLGTSDIDKDAILSYAIVHCGLTEELLENYDYPTEEEMIKELTTKNIGYDFLKSKPYDWARNKSKVKKYWLALHLAHGMGDICGVTTFPECDLMTFSFPCTDLSNAGLQKGASYEDWKNGLSTRSGLVWEIVRILENNKKANTLPKYLLLENVSALINNKNIEEFNRLNSLLGEIGYNCYYQVLNAKNYGVPQNRERVFGVYIRKDIDKGTFKFPKSNASNIRLIDILDEHVDAKRYLSPKVQKRYRCTDSTGTKMVVGTTKPSIRSIGQRDVVYNVNSCMGTLVATDYKQPKQILVEVSANELKQLGILDIKGMDCIRRVYSAEGIAPTLTTMQGGNRQPKILDDKVQLVRTLSPRECWALMGIDKENCDKCSEMGLSDSALYKQAGNGIVTNCITAIMDELYNAQW